MDENLKKSLPLFTMLPPFYDIPSNKDVNIFLRRIEKEFSIKIKKYSYLRWAFGNDVFIINDRFVFRFPRAKETINHLKYEIDFLNFLKDKVKINIPNYSYISKKGDFAGYNIIPRKLLTPSVFKQLNKKNKESVINQLVEFINEFHSISLNNFAKYEPLRRDHFIPIEQRIEKELKRKLFPRLSKKEVEMIKNFYKESKKYLLNIPNSCPIHGDLYAYSVIWDQDKSEVGIIDFSDYMVSDPAKDFEVFYDYGSDYAEMAYKQYKGPKDKDFLRRSQMYYKVHGIYTLLSSVLEARISFDYAYKHFFKKKFNL